MQPDKKLLRGVIKMGNGKFKQLSDEIAESRNKVDEYLKSLTVKQKGESDA